MSKEELEKLFGVKFRDYEVTFFNELMKAKKEGKKLTLLLARQGKCSRVLDYFNIYQAVVGGKK